MKKTYQIVRPLIVIFLIAACLYAVIGLYLPTFAWFAPGTSFNADINGRTTDPYFHRGDGTYNNPYTITRPVHLYNLAKLQEAGAFGNNSYYFQLGIEMQNGQIVDEPSYSIDQNGNVTANDNYQYFVYGLEDDDIPTSTVLDMTDFLKNGDDFIVPVGGSLITKGIDGLDLPENNYYPSEFLGFFQGNLLTIKNLKIQADDSFSHVGLFGAIGSASLVQNFILDDPTVITTSTNPATIDFPNLTDDEFQNYIGFIAGYTAGGLFNIGVYKGDMTVSSPLYASRYSWVGTANAQLSNNGDISGNILDTIIQWGLLVQQMSVAGTTWNSWKSNTTSVISQNYTNWRWDIGNPFNNSDPADDPYDRDVFEIAAPLIMQKINSAGFNATGTYNFPRMEYDLVGNPTGVIQLTTAPPKYNETITTNHVYPDGSSVDTVFQATGNASNLANGDGGIRFTVDYAGDLLLTYGGASQSTLGVYKLNDNGTTYSPYNRADWTFGTGKIANPTINDVRVVANSATASTGSSTAVSTCVVRVKDPGSYVIGTSSGNAVAFGYTRFIIDSSHGNTSGTDDTGSVDSITAVDFTYRFNNNLIFPYSTTFVAARLNLYFPNTTNNVTFPLTLNYRRDVAGTDVVFNAYSPIFSGNYYLSKYGNGSLHMLASPPND